VLLVFVIVSSFSILPSYVSANSSEGSFRLNVRGYPVTGRLENAIVQPDGSIVMNMIIDGNVQTPIGPAPISGRGVMDGRIDGSELSGTIRDVQGNVRVCFLFFCGQAEFIGEGNWTGSADGTYATGILDGTITFTTSSFPQVPLNQPQYVSGTWNAELQLPS
jgi:hypothetical protein